MPVPFFAFRVIYQELATKEWEGIKGSLPPLEYADRDKILAALAHPFASVGGKNAYPTVPAKAAALFRGLVKNHGLTDGNKRLAVTTMSTFLLANGWVPAYTNSQLYRYALRVAGRQGHYPVDLIEGWIRRNCRLMSDQELAILRTQNRRLTSHPRFWELVFDPEVNGLPERARLSGDTEPNDPGGTKAKEAR